MFIGHFAVAYLFSATVPGVPPLVPLIGVSFPDLLWPVLVLIGIETVKINPADPRQSSLTFLSYPWSHSFVLGTLIAVIPGAVCWYLFGPAAGLVFVAASASHWLLDAIVHVHDLPVLGFGRDTKAGAGLWRYGPAAFVIELGFYIAVTLVAVPAGAVVPLLVTGLAFHLVNANSFFGFSKKNPFANPRVYAAVTFVAIAVFIGIAAAVLA